MEKTNKDSVYVLKMSEIYKKSKDNFSNTYLSLGWCDSISIKEADIDFKNGCGIKSIVNYFYKERIELKEEDNKNNSDNISNNQMFFLFKNDNCKVFFENDCWNFRFITFVYIKEKDEIKGSFEEKYARYLKLENENLKIFDTLDNASFIAITKSLNYEEGLQKVLELSFGLDDNYCFTSVCLNKEYKLKEIRNDEDEIINKKIEAEKLDLKINFSINHYIEFFEKEKDLFPQYFENKKGYHLGNKDAYYKYVNISIKNIYEIYEFIKQNLSNISEFTFFINSSIEISSDSLGEVNKKFIELKDNKQNDKSGNNYELTSRLNGLSSIKDKISKIVDDSIYVSELKYNLLYIISNLEKMIYLDYCDYAFLSIYPSLNVFKDHFAFIMHSNVKRMELKDMYAYVRGAEELINLVSNSSYHTAHDTILKYEHNEICGKIVTFYNAYLNRIVYDITTNDDFKYSFLVVPQLCTHISVNVINNENSNDDIMQPGNRVLLVKIPINDIYNIPDVLISLTHESGHFIGNQMRCRKERFDILNDILANIVVNRFFEGLIDDNNQNQKETIEILQEYLYQSVLNKCEFYKKDFITKYGKTYENTMYYLANYEKYILINIIRDLYEKRDDILNQFIGRYEEIILRKKDEMLIVKQIEFMKKIKQKMYDNSLYFTSKSTNSLYFDMNKVLKVMRECFADLFAIKVLGINHDNYLKELFNNFYEIGKIDVDKSIYLRAALVCETLDWKIIKSNDFQVFIDEIENIRNIMINDDNNKNIEILRPFGMKKIFNKTISYLKQCNELFEKNKFKANKYQDLFHKLKYEDSDEAYLSRVMNIINKKIDEFRKKEYEEIAKSKKKD